MATLLSVDAVVAGAWVVVGAFFVIVGVVGLMSGLASRGWDAVSGEIIESRFRLSRWQHIGWEVEIRYRYTVEGFTYEGNQLGFWKRSTFSSQRAAERVVTRYPKGSIVTVFVSPSDRSRSVIERGVSWRAAMPLLSGGLLTAYGIVTLLR
jgi:hypothetical protein